MMEMITCALKALVSVLKIEIVHQKLCILLFVKRVKNCFFQDIIII